NDGEKEQEARAGPHCAFVQDPDFIAFGLFAEGEYAAHVDAYLLPVFAALALHFALPAEIRRRTEFHLDLQRLVPEYP
ncbi:MAG: hypothetical protein KAX84_14930, partial [Burkholderiales bacterium]|nr:hypothetical protein [Burkholderiales bacterium]